MTMTLERLDDSIVLFDLDRFPLKGARMLIDRSDTIGARLTLALSLSLSLSQAMLGFGPCLIPRQIPF